MRAPLEKTVETRCCRHAERRGFWQRKFKSPGKRSAPDRVFAREGTPAFFVEFKRRGKDPTELQLQEHATMRCAGLRVYVCDHFEQFVSILDAEETEAKIAVWDPAQR